MQNSFCLSTAIAAIVCVAVQAGEPNDRYAGYPPTSAAPASPSTAKFTGQPPEPISTWKAASLRSVGTVTAGGERKLPHDRLAALGAAVRVASTSDAYHAVGGSHRANANVLQANFVESTTATPNPAAAPVAWVSDAAGVEPKPLPPVERSGTAVLLRPQVDLPAVEAGRSAGNPLRHDGLSSSEARNPSLPMGETANPLR